MPRKRLTPEARAAQEGGTYIWYPHKTPGFSFVLANSGNAYEVSDSTCTCIWFLMHHRACKHIAAKRIKDAAKSAEKDAIR